MDAIFPGRKSIPKGGVMSRKQSIRIKVQNRPLLFIALAVAVCTTASRQLASETLTLITTYPSPLGIYRSMITTGGTPASPASTLFSRDAGDVRIGTTQASLDPQAKLMMGGNLDMNNHRVVNGAAPINPNDLATKAYVDAAMVGPGSWSCTVASASWGGLGAGGNTFSVACPAPEDKVISGGCISDCGNVINVMSAPAGQGWQCNGPFSTMGCLPHTITAYANCCH